MKTILAVGLILLAVVGACFADDINGILTETSTDTTATLLDHDISGLLLPAYRDAGEKDDTKFKVTISVTYNAVSWSEAKRIAGDAARRHRKACKAKAVIEKV